VARLNPYIGFVDNARQAMEFYQSVFGGQLDVNTFGQFGAAEGAEADKVMHAQLETPQGFTLMASDTPEGMEHKPGNNISVSLSGEQGDGLEEIFTKLSEGGTVTMPLEKQMWGDTFGMVLDRFGISWMVNVATSADAAQAQTAQTAESGQGATS
jgi:PhnB protein